MMTTLGRRGLDHEVSSEGLEALELMVSSKSKSDSSQE